MPLNTGGMFGNKPAQPQGKNLFGGPQQPNQIDGMFSKAPASNLFGGAP